MEPNFGGPRKPGMRGMTTHSPDSFSSPRSHASLNEDALEGGGRGEGKRRLPRCIPLEDSSRVAQLARYVQLPDTSAPMCSSGVGSGTSHRSLRCYRVCLRQFPTPRRECLPLLRPQRPQRPMVQEAPTLPVVVCVLVLVEPTLWQQSHPRTGKKSLAERVGGYRPECQCERIHASKS